MCHLGSMRRGKQAGNMLVSSKQVGSGQAQGSLAYLWVMTNIVSMLGNSCGTMLKGCGAALLF